MQVDFAALTADRVDAASPSVLQPSMQVDFETLTADYEGATLPSMLLPSTQADFGAPTFSPELKPIELISIRADQQLELHEEALELIRGLNSPLHVVSIAGVAREGKSAFLSLAMRHAQMDVPVEECCLQFKVNDGVQTETEGAWMWAANGFRTAHGGQAGSILLIDTQGLAKGKEEGLRRLFAMTTLISSVVVMNLLRLLNNDTMDKLTVLAALSKMMGGESPPSPPHLCLLLRDYELSVEEAGYSSLDEWLEVVINCEDYTQGQATTSARRVVQAMFRQRSMVATAAPEKADRQFLRSMCRATTTGMPPSGEFRDSVEAAIQHIIDRALAHPLRGLEGGALLDGQGLCDTLLALLPGVNGACIDIRAASRLIRSAAMRRLQQAVRRGVEEAAAGELRGCLPLSDAELALYWARLVAPQEEIYWQAVEGRGLAEATDPQELEQGLREVIHEQCTLWQRRNGTEAARRVTELGEAALASLTTRLELLESRGLHECEECIAACLECQDQFRAQTGFAEKAQQAEYVLRLQQLSKRYMKAAPEIGRAAEFVRGITEFETAIGLEGVYMARLEGYVDQLRQVDRGELLSVDPSLEESAMEIVAELNTRYRQHAGQRGSQASQTKMQTGGSWGSRLWEHMLGGNSFN